MRSKSAEKSKPGETHPPPLTAKQFKASPEFALFANGMQELLAVSKAELDRRVAEAKADSPRSDNPKSAGRKRKPRE